jgi:hypothetical protein
LGKKSGFEKYLAVLPSCLLAIKNDSDPSRPMHRRQARP